MNSFLYWIIWTAVATLGGKYSLTYLFDRNFSWIQTLIIIITYQWLWTLGISNRKFIEKRK